MNKTFFLIVITSIISNFTFSAYSQEKNEKLFNEYKKAEELFKKKKYSISLEKSLDLFSKITPSDQPNLYFKTSFLIGDVFREINDHNKAILYYKKTLSIYNSLRPFNDKENLSNNNLASRNNLNKLLLRIGSEFHIIKQKDSAIKYYKEILASNSFNQQDITAKASSYTNLSNIYREDSIYDLAKEYSFEAVKIYKKANKKVLEAAALGNLASIYLEQKDYEKLKKFIWKVLI